MSSISVLTGSARLSGEAQEKAKDLVRSADAQIKQLHLERKRKAMEARIADIRAEFKTRKPRPKIYKTRETASRKVSQDERR